MSREQRAESREQRAENSSNSGYECQQYKVNKYIELYNCKRGQRNKRNTENRKWCCFANYKKVFEVDVNIAACIMARDYKGFGSGIMYSNAVIELID